MSSRFFCPLLCGTKISNLALHVKTCVNKNMIGKYFLRCPYNPNHIIKAKVYEGHIENCDDRPKKEEKKEIEKKKKKKKMMIIILKLLNFLILLKLMKKLMKKMKNQLKKMIKKI